MFSNLRTFYDSHKHFCCCVLFWSGPSHFGKNALVGIQGDLKPILQEFTKKIMGLSPRKTSIGNGKSRDRETQDYQ